MKINKKDIYFAEILYIFYDSSHLISYPPTTRQ